jgi:hypothetical protein
MRLIRVYLAGIVFIGVAAFATRRADRRALPVAPLPAEAPVPGMGPPSETARVWFGRVKPFCNVVEVETALRQNRPPAEMGFEGPGFEAACWALAGRIEAARHSIDELPADQRWRAAGIVFEVAHPVADAGDDRSAGPIMAMVADYWPNHYMALYHAGISELALGDTQRSRDHLEAFLRIYHDDDGWRSNARAALDRIR